MKEDYKEAVAKYGPVKVYWKNTYNFETAENNPDFFLLSGKEVDQTFHYQSGPNDNNESINIAKTSFDSYEKQIFSFPKTIMAYIIKTESPNILHKLHKACKYMFVIRPYPVCHRLCYAPSSSNGRTFHGQSVVVYVDPCLNESNSVFQHKIIISNCLHAHGKIDFTKIHQCFVKYLQIDTDELSFKELVFLIEHGNVEWFEFSGVKIFNEDNNFVALEEILKFLLKIIVFKMTHCHTSIKTFQKLPDLQFTNKFQLFFLDHISYLEPYGFCDFLKKITDSKSICNITFKQGFENFSEIKSIVEKEIRIYWPEDHKPKVYLIMKNRDEYANL